MKRLAIALFLLAACKNETPVNTDTMDTRAPIAVRYVGTPDLAVHAEPSDSAKVLATYQNGEAISVLSEKGDWAEVRTGDRAGWAHKADLTNAEGKKAQEDNPQPNFRVMPLPVSAPSAHGEIYIEANVNSDGDVTDVKVITNTTNSEALAAQNSDALRSAKFYPIVQKGARRPFKYYHRVMY